MKRAAQMAIFFPALIGWIIFAPSFRAANWLSERVGLHEGRFCLWFWCGVEAREHERYYSVYGDEEGYPQ